MPAKSKGKNAAPKSGRKGPVGGRRIAAKAGGIKGRIKAARIAGTGLTSRIRGHVSARGRRAQARRDSR